MSTLENFTKLNLSIKSMRKEIKKQKKDELSWLKSELENLLSSKQFSEKSKIYYKLNLRDIDKIETRKEEAFYFSFSRNAVVFQYYPDKKYMGDFFSLVVKKNKIKDFYYINLTLFGTYLTKKEEVSMKIYFIKEVIDTLVDYVLDDMDKYMQLDFSDLVNEVAEIKNTHQSKNKVVKVKDLKLGDIFLFEDEKYLYIDKPRCNSFKFHTVFNMKEKTVDYFKGYVNVVKI